MTLAAFLGVLGLYLILVASSFAVHFVIRTKIPRGAAMRRASAPVGSPALGAAPRVWAHRSGRTLVFAGLLVFISPVLALVAVGYVATASVTRRRRQAQRDRSVIAAGTAEAIDLFGVMLHAGHALPDCVRQAGQWLDGPVGATFVWCHDQTRLGVRLSDALEDVPDRISPHGAITRPFIAALVANERYGAPIAHGLVQLAADTRADQRRQAETSARRLPVSLLFPLVACVLPAFMLLTVVPALGETLWSLELFASPE